MYGFRLVLLPLPPASCASLRAREVDKKPSQQPSPLENTTFELMGSVGEYKVRLIDCIIAAAMATNVFQSLFLFTRLFPRSLAVSVLLSFYAHTNAQVITQCPRAETTYTSPSGRVYNTCTGTDYHGTSYQVVSNTANAAACVPLCDQDTANACDKSVHDNDNNCDCHLKGSDTDSLRRTTRTRSTASRRVMTGNVGKWGPLVQFLVIPVAAYVVPTQPDRLLVFSAYASNDFGDASGHTQ